MLERVRRTLVESLVAPIGLGYLLAQLILQFMNIFAAPASLWITRLSFPDAAPSKRFPVEAALPQIPRFVLLLLLWYVLLRWLYFKSLKRANA
jgi:hypothetical protein